MPKENKSTSKKSRRQHSDIDNENISSVREPLKPTVAGNRYSPFPREAPARDSRKAKENMSMPTIEALHSLRGGSSSDKSSTKPESFRSNDEMVTAEEDSDSSNEQWSNANSTMAMNMSLEYDNMDRFISYSILEEPMDISIDEHSFSKNPMTNISQHNKSGIQNNAIRSKSSKSYTDAKDSNSAVDEEIARIFQKQCTSSEDEFSSSSFPKSFASCKYEKPKENNFLYKKVNNNYSPVASRSRKGSKHDTERKKKTSTEFVANNKRRKVILDEDGNEKDIEHRSEKKTPEGKRNSRLDIPTKYKSRSPRTPVKDKGSKRKNIKYKETATQTDSAFSTDDDVEMVPVDTKPSDRQVYSKYVNRKYRINLFQGKELEQELNYVADNEDSNDGFSRIAHKRVSSCSTSSSSTDLGFDERASATPDMDITTGQRHTNSSNNINTLRTCTRAPPGFPQLPQYPPLTPFIYDVEDFILVPSKNDDGTNSSLINTVAGVPPAPSPMRHLYYDYPEFMDLPIYVNSSKILNNILKNNYYR
ncbi:hypothetical protein WN48_09336 [Eufriesea mexicana]|nr:hypothetical protein WN48_09336 [Eufriesea mexicana]